MVTGQYVMVRLYATYKDQIENAIRFWHGLRDEAREHGDLEKIQLYNEQIYELRRIGRRLRIPGSL